MWKYDCLKCQKLFMYLFETASVSDFNSDLNLSFLSRHLKPEHWCFHFEGVYQTHDLKIHFGKKQFLLCLGETVSWLNIHVFYQNPQGEIFKVWMVFRFVGSDLWQLNLYHKHKRDTNVLFMKNIHMFFLKSTRWNLQSMNGL